MAPESAIRDDAEQQLRRACEELRERLRAGESCRSEDFLESRPSLSSSPDYAFVLILTELSTRRELGQTLEPADWYTRFPRCREKVEEWFRSQGLLADSVVPDPVTARQDELTAERLPSTAPLIRARLGRYEVLDTLGKGAMGVVYRARDTLLGRVVALKTIRGGKLARPEEIERFLQEAKAAAKLHHPHIIPLYDFGELEDQHFITMAFAAGGSLAKRRELFGADPHAIAALMEKIARAVHHLHTKGILHRDLKPGNIMLDERAEPLVSDFGLAKLLDADAELTQDGVVVGTPAYLAPELAAAQPEHATVRSDVWSLGVMLYELLTCDRPFAGVGAKVVTQNILLSNPIPPRKKRPQLDRTLETIVLKCLEKDPARRYTSAQELADDLGSWQRGEPIHARPEGWLRHGMRLLRRHGVWVSGMLVAVVATGIIVTLLPRGIKENDVPVPSRQPIALFDPQYQHADWIVVGRGKVSKVATGVVSLDAEPKEIALLPLLNAPPWKSYRFKVEVKDVGASGVVGIYAVCQQSAGLSSQEYWFYETSFAERNEHPPKPSNKGRTMPGIVASVVACLAGPLQQGPLATASALCPGRAEVNVAKRSLNAHRYVPGPPVHDGVVHVEDVIFKGERQTWRQLIIEVTPNKICAFWEQATTPFATVPHRANMKQHASRLAMIPLHPHVAPDGFGSRGGLGLFARGGHALVRRAVIEPVPGD
jgi:tRNA A-37 threonylcarbamoyl transferase component Bud32